MHYMQGVELEVGPAEGKLRCDPVRASSHRKSPHGYFIFLGHIGQGECAVHCQTLLRHMPTEQLQLGTDDALLREIRDELMPKEMRIDPLRNTRALVPFDGRPSRAILLDVTAV